MIIERTNNTIRNTIWGFVNKLVMIIFPFIIRTIIIRSLGAEYSGIHSLFVSIVSMLGLAELGFDTAMVYSMYQPLANGDDSTIRALLKFYKKVYRVIGAVILIIGLFLLPFLPKLINGSVPDDINVYLLYGIYLFNTVSSYWLFAYKNSVLIALQRNDVSINISTVCNFLMYIVQIALLTCTKNYYFYVLWMPVCSISINLLTARYTSKHYPQYYCEGDLSKNKIGEIKKQVFGLFSQRLALTSRNAFDSIILSAFFGLIVVGIYNNYFYILNAISAVLAILFTSMQSGIGNSVVVETVEKNIKDFHKIHFLYMLIAGWCSICFFVMVQPFMQIWVGEKLMFSLGIAGILSFYFYSTKMTDTVNAYLSATGLWWKCKYTYLFEALVNLILNIILSKLFGVIGIIVATLISVLFINYLCTLVVLCKYYFGRYEFKVYLIKELKCLVSTVIIGVVLWILLTNLNITNLYISLAIRILACFTIAPCLYLLIYHKNPEAVESVYWLLPNIKKFIKRNN